MTDRDEDLDLDRPEVTKVLLGEAAVKKKPKAKAKKTKEEGASTSKKDASILPLSMLAASSEDTALFESKFSSNKGAASSAKAYNMNDRYKTGDVINHKKFGVGFVVAESGLNKIEVIFKGGRKLLVIGAPKTK